MALVDKNGLTEAEFLAAYKQKDYPKPSLTADMAIFRPAAGAAEWEVLLIRRGGHPFLGCWALPGGFVNQGEDCDDAAARELEEETGLAGFPLEEIGLYSTPGRDPRAWTVSEAYLAVVEAGQLAHAGDDAADAQWFALALEELGEGKDGYRLSARAGDDVLSVRFTVKPHVYDAPRALVEEAQGFAFDHGRIVADAYLRLTDFEREA